MKGLEFDVKGLEFDVKGLKFRIYAPTHTHKKARI